ncbi:hypothetical protein LX73_0791 [Fodinibius salinus]|uniref:Uncharacterized protein n=1 Tax=Fodinibius salinus TaxID=860790 RepID=A0A5D3YMT2_9BACT|nr:hypothetical protein [Fodinibius salinus]TYP95485.1 hypothetical protein LX73_0791 [Fodinibius salinus]
MFGEKSWLIKTLGLFFLLILPILLVLYFNSSILSIGLILLEGAAVGLIFGSIIALIFSVINPPQWLFTYRYILEGILWGLMIATTSLFVTTSEESLSMSKAVFTTLFCSGMGVLWIYYFKYKKLQQQMEEYLSGNLDTVDLCDVANFSDQEYDNKNSLLLLSASHIQIVSIDTHKKLADLQLSEINPKIRRRTWFNFPAGIQLSNTKEVKVKFPLYWFKKISMQKR